MNTTQTKVKSSDIKDIFEKSLNLDEDNGRSSNVIKPLEEEAQEFDKSISLEDVISKTIDIIFEDSSYYKTDDLDNHLQRIFELQEEIFHKVDMDENLKTRSFVSKGGNVISPEHCTNTIKDTIRVRAYIRSVHFALEKLLNRYSNDETINIIYPACGPFAPLLLPLVTKYKKEKRYEGKIKITLIDIQRGATLALQSLISRLDITEYVEDIYEMDALDYMPNEGKKIHMVVLEAMNHGFTKEGHLLLTKHFSKFLDKDGIFLPQKVTVKAFLNKPQTEYVDQWNGEDDLKSREINRKAEILEQRTEVGDVLTLTQDNIKNFEELPSSDPDVKLIECATLKIPTPKGEFSKQYLLFSTYVDVYNDEKVGEYDSGISHPYPMTNFCLNFKPTDIQDDDILVKSGDVVTFYYRLDGLPSFIPFKKKEFNR